MPKTSAASASLADVDVGDEPGHRLGGLGARPELAAVVKVAAHGDALRLAGLEGIQADLGAFATKRGSDAGEVEPVGAGEDLVPVEVRALRERDGGAGTVVDDLGGALGGALLDEVDAETRTAPDDVLRVDAETADLVASGGAKRVVGELRDVARVHAVVREGDGDVRLSARIARLELLGLHEPQIAFGVETHHDFAKTDNTLHRSLKFKG